MAVFAISDLHLDVKTNKKSMEVFGNRWKGYTEKLKKNWAAVVATQDTVILPGDISWALNTEAALEDLKWIDALPGKKIISKGNHDFWWSTVSKMKHFLEENSIHSIDFLNNNAFEVEQYIIAGSRGWFTDKSMQTTNGEVDYCKMINREVIRLRLSLDAAKKLNMETNKKILVFLHFPPLWGDFSCNEILDVLKEYKIDTCYFGHIHGCYAQNGSFEQDGIHFRMISADYLDFLPLIV